MQSFKFQKAGSLAEATHGHEAKRKFLAGGTTLIDLMKLEVETPSTVLDINHLPWKKVEEGAEGLRVGALVTNSDLAHHEGVKKHYQVLSEAILAGASPQLRNKATTGGNLLQRTRCVYFRDATKNCNKRVPGSGCSAIEGHNRNLAILGTSESCIASNPSDMNVALAALEAMVHLHDGKAERKVSLADFHTLPGKNPEIETSMKEGELISGISIPKLPDGSHSFYIKLRDRASYEFALASIAVVITKKGGQVERLRFAMGGVGTKPWRVPAVEKMLEGKSPTASDIKAAAEAFLAGAKGFSENAFKIELARRCLVRGLTLACGKAAA